MLYFIPCALVIFALFIPRITVGNTWVGLDDFMLMTIVPLVLSMRFGKVSKLSVIILPLLIFIILFIPLGMIQGLSYLDDARLPTEIWQHIKRASAFLLFAYVARYEPLKNVKTISTLFIFALLGYQTIGFLQVFGGGFGEELSAMYARTEAQLEDATRETATRIFGVAGLSTSWGAFSIFSLFALLGLMSLSNKLLFTSNRMMSFFLIFLAIVLSLVNLFYSGSRGALIAAAISIVFFVFIYSCAKPARFLVVIPVSICALALLLIFVWRNIETFRFVIYRFEVLVESQGGGRVDQILSALSLLDFPYEYAVGVSNQVQRQFAVSHGVEIEFINILVSYGIIGFLLLYLQLSMLFFGVSVKKRSPENHLKIASISVQSIIVMYLLFSFGYFFYAELIVGVLPWAYFGLVYGLIKRVKGWETFSRDASAKSIQSSDVRIL